VDVDVDVDLPPPSSSTRGNPDTTVGELGEQPLATEQFSTYKDISAKIHTDTHI
jgi:hypothetical protein